MRHKKRVFLIGLMFILFFVGCEENTSTQTNEASSDSSQSTQSDSLQLPEDALQKGDSGDAVEQLQLVLIEIGYDIEQTGVYDELTTWAITDIQLQFDEDYVTGIYNDQVQAIMSDVMTKSLTISPDQKLQKPKNPDQFTDIIENPYDILALVNKQYALPDGYEPFDLTVPDIRFPFDEDDPKKQLRNVAAEALEEMFKQADDDGIELYAQSGFRSFQRQEAIFAANVERDGEEKANTYSARPGESEHQTGLVMDVTSRTIGFRLEVEFGETAEGQWVEQNAHNYGFIIRYPEGKESITEYQYEPWHLRYVGTKAAKEITENNLTLEEYLKGS